MAAFEDREILLLENSVVLQERGPTRHIWETLFFFELDPPIEDDQGANVSVTPSTTLPFDVQRRNFLTTEELAALDDGTWFFSSGSVELRGNRPNENQLNAAARAEYNQQEPIQIAAARASHEFFGSFVSSSPGP